MWDRADWAETRGASRPLGHDVAIPLRNGDAIQAAFFPAPEPDRPGPGVLVIHELLGLSEVALCRRLIGSAWRLGCAPSRWRFLLR